MWSWWREMEYQRYQLRDIGDIVSGATPKTTVAENFGGAIPWLTPADLSGYTQKYISRGKRNLTQLGYDSCSTQIMPSGTVLFSSRAPIGYTAIAKNPICTNQGFKSIVPKPFVNSEFLYYQLIYLRKTIQDMGSGTTFKEISAKKFGAVQVTIPPLVEQEHIISRIEELFSQLDVSVNELKTAKERLKVYRQAVLKEAFEGDYPQVQLKEISTAISGYAFKSKALTEPIVILPNIEQQWRIVEEIESRLSVCDSIEKTVDTALLQAKALQQSILKKAFEGRLL